LGDFLKRQPDFQSHPFGKYTIHTWTRPRGRDGEEKIAGCLDHPQAMLFGRQTGPIKRALEVRDGTAPGLPADDWLSQGSSVADVILQGRGTGLAAAKLPFHSAVLHQSDRAAAAAGENQRGIFIQATLATASTQVAEQLEDVVKGFLAMARLQSAADAEATRMLQAAEVTRDERTVTIRWSGAGEDVLRCVEKLQAKQKNSKPTQ